MGTKYCKPVRDPPVALEPLQSMTMLEVRTKANLMTRTFQKKGYYFFSNNELKNVFLFTDEQLYFVLSSFSSSDHINRVSSLDFWCALALSASGSSDEKISFGFKMIDTNNDDFISHNELLLLFICATRGVARLKGLEPIPETTIDKLVLRGFESYRKDLNDHGELSLKSLCEYLLTSDTCRAYLAGLGAKLPPVDTGAMVQKRANILRELASLRYQMDDILCDIEEGNDSLDLKKERGGDIELLRLAELNPLTRADSQANIQAQNQVQTEPNQRTPLELTNKVESDLSGPTSDVDATSPNHDLEVLLNDLSTSENDRFEQIKFALGKSHPVNKYFGYDDSWIGEIYNKPTPHLDNNSKKIQPDATATEGHLNLYGQAFEDALLKEWKKIPQEADLMVDFDEFTMKAMLQQLNINVTFYFARKCIQSLPRNQLNQFSFFDFLSWFRIHFVENPLELNPGRNHSKFTQSWFNAVRRVQDKAIKIRSVWKDTWKTIVRQRKITSGKQVILVCMQIGVGRRIFLHGISYLRGSFEVFDA
jgi:Ca2+-binding EF-hand superfamily protein